MIKIYALVDPDDLDTYRYIGKTKMTLRKRLQSHIDESKSAIKLYKKRTYKINWIYSLLKRGKRPLIVLVDECSEFEWVEKEKFYIKKYSELFKLTNESEGGYGGSIGLTSKIIKYSLDGVFIEVYQSIEEACFKNNLERGVINSALQRNPLGGFGGNYLWRYYNNKYPQYIEPFIEVGIITRIKDLETGRCEVHLSLKEALKSFGLKRCGGINEAINKKIPFKKRYSIIRLN
ncbi:MAG: hypothetical protein EOL97_16815 [Spirochaetia bacterium]|nr:hypothetical protein [Spirochaetia bacterium]